MLLYIELFLLAIMYQLRLSVVIWPYFMDTLWRLCICSLTCLWDGHLTASILHDCDASRINLWSFSSFDCLKRIQWIRTLSTGPYYLETSITKCMANNSRQAEVDTFLRRAVGGCIRNKNKTSFLRHFQSGLGIERLYLYGINMDGILTFNGWQMLVLI